MTEKNGKQSGHIDTICQLISGKRENDALALIQKLSNPNECSSYEQTVFGAAATWNAISIVKYYVETLQVPVDYAEKSGMTPLMNACCHGNFEIAAYLIGHGADVNSISTDGYTPLSWAVENGSPPLVKLLVEKGANPRYVNEQSNESIIKTAKAECWNEIVNYLRAIGVPE